MTALRPLALGPGHDHGFDLVADNDVTHVVGWISEWDDPYLAKLYEGTRIIELTADTFAELKDEIREHGFDLEHDEAIENAGCPQCDAPNFHWRCSTCGYPERQYGTDY